jgi:hypothetical protein
MTAPTTPKTPTALIGTPVAAAKPELDVRPQSKLGVGLTGTNTPLGTILWLSTLPLALETPLLLVIPLPLPLPLAVTAGLLVPVITVTSSVGTGTVAPPPGLTASLKLLIALSSASMLLWYSVGRASSQAGGVAAVKALWMMDAGSAVVEANEV